MSLALGHGLAETAAAEGDHHRRDTSLDDDKEAIFDEKSTEKKTIRKLKTTKKEFNPSKEIKNSMKITRNIDFLKSTLASKIGHVIFESFVYLNHLYYIPEPTENEEYNASSKKTKEFAKKSASEIHKLIVKLKNTPKNKEPDVRHSTITATQELNFAIASYLSLYLNAKPESIMREIDFDQASESLQICATRIGLEIIELLKNIGAVTEELNKQNYPRITLAKQFEVDLYASASYFKPLLIPQMTENVTHKVKKNNFDILLELNTNTIPNKGSTQITGTPELDEVITYAGAIPYTINENNFNFLMELITNAASLSPKDPAAREYMHAIYNLNFEEYLKNNTDSKDKEIMEELIRYGLDLMEPRDNVLYHQCKEHIGFLAAFHKIRSYKYYLKGFINVCNLYKHFKKLYIPKYLTSTGRVFSKTYFLQFQGNKIAKALLCFTQQKVISTDEDIQKINEIIKKHFPDVNEKLFFSTSKRYDDQIKGLFNMQIFSLLKKDANIDTYPYKGNASNQLSWLTTNCKKAGESFYVRGLIQGVINNNIFTLPYEKDATSSGSQIISMVMRDRIFAKRVNVMGNEYHDLYDELAKAFKIEMKNITASIEQVFKYLFEEPFNDSGVPIKATPLSQILNTSKTQDEFVGIFSREYRKLPLDLKYIIASIQFVIYCLHIYRI